MSEKERPKVGVAVLIWRNGKVIFCKRHRSHGDNTWQMPGGHLEFGESWAEAAAREAKEEVGVEITNIRFLTATNDVFDTEDKHYVTIWMQADWSANEPASQEPEKITNVEWRKLNDLPSPLFEPCYANLKKVKPELFA